MGVDLTHYLGIGVKLDYDTYYEKVDEYETKNPKYSCYEFISSIKENHIQFVVDGMDGNYIYLMYPYKITELEDMYSSWEDQFILPKIIDDKIVDEIKKVYFDITGKELDEVNTISLFHCS
jgi:hypothetical protein